MREMSKKDDLYSSLARKGETKVQVQTEFQGLTTGVRTEAECLRNIPT